MNGANYTSELPTRQRMRPWLEARINSQDIHGLEWTDKNNKVFKVPWKHVGNREWTESDGKIFKEWAVHTGRYREGVDAADWPTWKTRFRCALTKLPDIKELKDQNRLDGQTEEPYRVYQFLKRTNGNSAQYTPMQQMQFQTFDEVDGFDMISDLPSEQTIPTTVNLDNSTAEQRLDSDLNNINSGDLIKCESTDIREHYEDMDTEDAPVLDRTVELISNQVLDIAEKANKVYPGQTSEPPTKLNLLLDANDSKLYVIVRYRQDIVYEGLCASSSGCRILHDINIDISTQGAEVYEDMYGPMDAMEIRLPECNTSNSQQLKLTTTLLGVTDRGVLLKVENGNIYATRKCRCSIYVSTPSFKNGETTKLVREEKTMIFDLNGYFKPALQKYLYDRGPQPSAEVVMCFGQKFDQTKASLSSLLISASIVHTEANNLLTRIVCSSPLSPSLDISKSDNNDRILDMLKFSRETQQF